MSPCGESGRVEEEEPNSPKERKIVTRFRRVSEEEGIIPEKPLLHEEVLLAARRKTGELNMEMDERARS